MSTSNAAINFDSSLPRTYSDSWREAYGQNEDTHRLSSYQAPNVIYPKMPNAPQTISARELPPEITNNYMTGSPQYTGTKAELSGAADVNLKLTLTDTRTMFTAETSRNTARNIRVNTGSAVEARNML